MTPLATSHADNILQEIILVDFSVAEPSTSMVYPSETESASKSRRT